MSFLPCVQQKICWQSMFNMCVYMYRLTLLFLFKTKRFFGFTIFLCQIDCIYIEFVSSVVNTLYNLGTEKNVNMYCGWYMNSNEKKLLISFKVYLSQEGNRLTPLMLTAVKTCMLDYRLRDTISNKSQGMSVSINFPHSSVIIIKRVPGIIFQAKATHVMFLWG